MSIPLIYLAFANDKKDFLPELIQERKEIKNSFEDFTKKGTIRLEVEDHATSKDILDFFKKNESVLIFHFGGHSNSKSLKTNDANLMLYGLAEILKDKNIKLVFLNGCANAENVPYFIKNDITVIATSRLIGDKLAKNFAKNFYHFLSHGKSLKQAFEHAKSYHLAIESNRSIEIRGLGKKEKLRLNEKDEFPWGLYYNKNNKEILNWKIKQQRTLSKKVITSIFIMLAFTTFVVASPSFQNILELLLSKSPTTEKKINPNSTNECGTLSILNSTNKNDFNRFFKTINQKSDSIYLQVKVREPFTYFRIVWQNGEEPENIDISKKNLEYIMAHKYKKEGEKIISFQYNFACRNTRIPLIIKDTIRISNID